MILQTWKKNQSCRNLLKERKIKLAGTLTLSWCFKSNLYSQVWCLTLSLQLKNIQPTFFLPVLPTILFIPFFKDTVHILNSFSPIQGVQPPPKKKRFQQLHIHSWTTSHSLGLSICVAKTRDNTSRHLYNSLFWWPKMESCEEVDFGTDFNNWHPKSASF